MLGEHTVWAAAGPDWAGGFTFESVLPDILTKAQEAYVMYAPLGWLVMGLMIGFYVLGQLVDLVRAATRRYDDDE